MERFTTKRHRLWYNQHFQEWAQQVEEESDRLLHGPAGPPGPMASSALKNSEEQVRPHGKQPGKKIASNRLNVRPQGRKIVNSTPYFPSFTDGK